MSIVIFFSFLSPISLYDIDRNKNVEKKEVLNYLPLLKTSNLTLLVSPIILGSFSVA